jgi:hypothetical protein
MHMTLLSLPRPSRTVLRAVPYAGVAAATVLALAACGPATASGGGGAPAGGSTAAPTGAAGAGGGQRQPGVNGLIAAVSGSTMQVQTRTDQTAVSWNDTTTFTTVESAALSDVIVGTCVTVLEPAASGTATGSATSGPATQVTAASVEVRPATNGECAGGFGGAGGPGGTAGAPGAGATAPAGAPTGAPTGTATNGTGGRGGGDFGRRAVTGLVTAVSGDTITVQETMRVRGDGTASSTATASPTTATVTVTTTSSTTYTAQKAGAATDVAVGVCASALGKADDTGAVTATSIMLRPTTNGSCTTGFGGAGGRGGATGTATTTGGANG